MFRADLFLSILIYELAPASRFVYNCRFQIFQGELVDPQVECEQYILYKKDKTDFCVKWVNSEKGKNIVSFKNKSYSLAHQ